VAGELAIGDPVAGGPLGRDSAAGESASGRGGAIAPTTTSGLFSAACGSPNIHSKPASLNP
jgi:hypothetical protein